MSDKKPLSLSDLFIGRSFVSSSHMMTAKEIKAYARLYDPQPFHVDEEAARASVFGELVASGWHSCSVSMRLIVESINLDCGLIGIGGTVSWLKPVRPGDSIRVESEISDIKPSRSKPNQAIVVMHCTVKNQHDETVIDFMPKLMVFGGAAQKTA